VLDDFVSPQTSQKGIRASETPALPDDFVLLNKKTVSQNRLHNKHICEKYLAQTWRDTHAYNLWEHGFSQSGQDKWLWDEVFGRKMNGVFVDVGAFDGQTHSNSAILEYCFNWSGLLVEANPVQAAKIVTWRPCSLTYNVAASETNKICRFVSKLDPELSGVEEGIKNQVDASDTTINIPCIRLGDLFSRHGLVKIDYLSLDTEGVEPMALRTIDFDKVEIDIIGIEENNHRDQLRKILEPRGYSLCHTLGPDVFFCRNGFHKKSVSDTT
jgi:FkbM family methyltransferase